MVRSVPAEELLRSAREATGTLNVREAVRELTLHALRCRPLTATHIAMVMLTVGRGIESSDLPPTATVRETHRGAWAGLEDAVGQALLASGDRERLVAEIAQLERTLGGDWTHPGTVPSALRARIESAIAFLSRALPDGAAHPAACLPRSP